MRLRDLAAVRVRDGYRRLHLWLQREGWRVNHQRVYRLCRLAGLSLRLKRRQERPSHLRVVMPAAQALNEPGRLDCITDS
jgi:putative transposase